MKNFTENQILSKSSISALYGGRQVIDTQTDSYCDGVHMTLEDKIIIHNDGSVTTKIYPVK